MYVAVVLLTMLVLPLGSAAAELARGGSEPVWTLLRWFVFWAVGVRLLLAGARQLAQPAFTLRTIFGVDTPEALPIVRELGVANLASGIIGIASLWRPDFVVPAAIGAAIFYGVAGVRHAAAHHRTGQETVALASDLWVAAVLIAGLAYRAAT